MPTMPTPESVIVGEPAPFALDPSVPVACIPGAFDEAARAEHMSACVDAVVRWPRRRSELEDGYLFEYEGDEERFVALARWMAGEHRCCPWAACSLEMAPFTAGQPGALRVRFRATAEGKAFMKMAYAYMEKLQGERPPDALFLADRISVNDVRRELRRCEAG